MGGSYAGALAAWFRLKFPHLAIGAHASSGVIDAVLDYQDFDRQVAISAGPECSKLLRYLAEETDRRLDLSEESNRQFKEAFGTPYLNDGDFTYMLADSSAMAVQYGYTEHLCDPLMNAANSGKDVMQTFIEYTKISFTLL